MDAEKIEQLDGYRLVICGTSELPQFSYKPI